MPLGGCLTPAPQGISPPLAAGPACCLLFCLHGPGPPWPSLLGNIGFFVYSCSCRCRIWVELDMLLSRGCCLLGNYFPLCCTPLQVLESVCAEQVYFRAVNSCCNRS